MDFAKWVGNLKPGRIVYASPNACPHWDLLLRLNWPAAQLMTSRGMLRLRSASAGSCEGVWSCCPLRFRSTMRLLDRHSHIG